MISDSIFSVFSLYFSLCLLLSSFACFCYSFESMKTLCEKYNKAVDNVRKLVSERVPSSPPPQSSLPLQWSGRQPPPCIDAPPSLSLLKHILDQVYNRAITKPEELNTYQAFSPEVGVVCIKGCGLYKGCVVCIKGGISHYQSPTVYKSLLAIMCSNHVYNYEFCYYQ